MKQFAGSFLVSFGVTTLLKSRQSFINQQNNNFGNKSEDVDEQNQDFIKDNLIQEAIDEILLKKGKKNVILISGEGAKQVANEVLKVSSKTFEVIPIAITINEIKQQNKKKAFLSNNDNKQEEEKEKKTTLLVANDLISLVYFIQSNNQPYDFYSMKKVKNKQDCMNRLRFVSNLLNHPIIEEAWFMKNCNKLIDFLESADPDLLINNWKVINSSTTLEEFIVSKQQEIINNTNLNEMKPPLLDLILSLYYNSDSTWVKENKKVYLSLEETNDLLLYDAFPYNQTLFKIDLLVEEEEGKQTIAISLMPAFQMLLHTNKEFFHFLQNFDRTNRVKNLKKEIFEMGNQIVELQLKLKNERFLLLLFHSFLLANTNRLH